MSTPIILTCGYRRTGKDTLYSILSNPQSIINRFKWRIYKHKSQINRKFPENVSYERTAFADHLKLEASVIYGIPSVVPDSEKDLKQFIHYKTGDLVSARDIYIEWGAIRRQEDPEYWCKAVCKFLANSSNNTCVVTDWRYCNESTYMLNQYDNVLTVRVYRSDVPEPPAHIESEHDLDEYRTDFLLLNDELENEFQKTIEKFPQYNDYVPCEYI
jgi:hypothetical protein